jgi:uncharacterized protein (TIGR03067 family)
MRRLTGAVLFAALAIPAAAGAQDDAAKAAKKLEGTYEALEILIDGKPSDKAKDVASVVIKDGTITVKTGKKDEPATFTVDPSKKPAHIDLMGGSDRKIEGIYEAKESAKGLELTIAFPRGGKGERPKDFKGEGMNEMVLKLLRKKDK